MTSGADISEYNAALAADARIFADELRQIFDAKLNQSSGKVWHGHPVWFIDGNPIAGYSLKKSGVEVLFWSGQSFNETALRPIGKFKAAGLSVANSDDIAKVVSCMPQALAIQWDYKNLPQLRKLEKQGDFQTMSQPFLYSVEREYDTSIENLWRAWADPKALEVWYSPTDLSVLPGSVENVAEVGGIWTVAVDVPMNDMVAYFYGNYTEVVAHQRLVHTMCYTQDATEFITRTDAPHHDIVIDFEVRGDKSWVKFSQFGVLPEGQAPLAQAGMESYFDNLGLYLSN